MPLGLIPSIAKINKYNKGGQIYMENNSRYLLTNVGGQELGLNDEAED